LLNRPLNKIISEPFYKGVKIAYNHHELGIKLGGILTILGDITYNIKDGSLKMANPTLIMKDKRSLLDILGKKVKNWYKFLII